MVIHLASLAPTTPQAKDVSVISSWIKRNPVHPRKKPLVGITILKSGAIGHRELLQTTVTGPCVVMY